MMMEAFTMPQALQHKELASGSTETVFYYKVPSGYTAFIQKIGTVFYTGFKCYFYIDGELFEPITERGFGNTASPEVMNPPIVANYEIKFVIYNGTGGVRDVDIYMDVIVVRQEGGK